jgi:two-component system cell cycle response regulator
MMRAQPIRLLLVEHEKEDARRLMSMLQAAERKIFRLRYARRFRDARKYLLNPGTDIALLDLWLPDANGLEGVREMHDTAPGIPLVVLSSYADDSLAAEALRHGAQDFLVKSELDDSKLVRALCYAIARQHVQMSLRTLSLVDELTGLYNRRGFLTLAQQRLKLAFRQGLRSSLVFVDVDDLKYVNDRFGHNEGDRALQRTGQVLQECFRDSDIVARIGGDEFCALLGDAPESSASLVRERLYRALEKQNAVPNCHRSLSVSLGIVEVTGPDGLEHQLARADAKMYEHKRRKRAQRLGAATPRQRAPVRAEKTTRQFADQRTAEESETS